jgi:PAS domain S-box-containing protein
LIVPPSDVEGRYRELLRTVVDNAPIVLFALDSQGTFTLSQGRGLKDLGLEPGQVVGMSALEVYRGVPWIVKAIRQALRGEELTSSGEVAGRWYETRYFPLRDESGAIQGTIGVATDVTEQRRADLQRVELLRREQVARTDAEMAHRRAAFLAEASRQLAKSLDYDATLSAVARLAIPDLADWCVVDVFERGGALRRLAVVHPEPAMADLAARLQRRLPDPNAAIGIPQALRSGRSAAYTERSFFGSDNGHPFGTRDEECREIVRRLGARSCIVVPMVDRGRTLGALTFVRSSQPEYAVDEIDLAEDLARRAALAVDNARLYAEAQEAIRAREEFLSIASHELKTPMTSLQLAVQAVRRTVEALPDRDERVVAIVRTADRQARRISSLVETLLDLTRIETDRLELARGACELGELAREVAAGLKEELQRASCTVTIDAGAPVHGRWDRSRLEQVLTNLLANAMKYGEGKPIEIVVEREGATAALCVRDHGIGIDEERQAEIFDRFERAVSVQHYGGLGLGLYIVRRIVEAHGGGVSVRSVPGQGATFTVRLPIDPSSP